MDYEKKYKEALAKARTIIEDYKKRNLNDILFYVQEDLSEIFPELKESEEDIRTGLINGFNECLKNSQYPKNAQKYWHNIKIEDILAWLENQCESDETKAKMFLINKGYPIDANGVFPTYEEMYNIIREGLEHQGFSVENTVDKVEPKFKIGDFIVNDYCMGKVIKLTNDAYLLDTEQGIPFSCDHNVHLWTIEDAKDGDVLLSKYNQPFIYNGIFDEESVGAYCGIDKLGNDFLVDTFSCDWSYKEGVKPATKEQREFLFSKMKDAGYEWDVEKKELRRKVEPKFKIDDWITNGRYNKLIVGINSDWPFYMFKDGTSEHIKDVDKKYHLWTIQDVKDGDVLIANIHHWEIGGNIEKLPVRVPTIFIYQEVKTDNKNIHAYVSLFDNTILEYRNMYYIDEYGIKDIHLATKEQRELLFQKMKEAGYERDAEKKE